MKKVFQLTGRALPSSREKETSELPSPSLIPKSLH